MKILSLVVLVVGLLGCRATERPDYHVIARASFEHDCPKDQIRIIEKDRPILAYRLDVCGQTRKYLYTGSGSNYTYFFVEVVPNKPLPPPHVEQDNDPR